MTPNRTFVCIAFFASLTASAASYKHILSISKIPTTTGEGASLPGCKAAKPFSRVLLNGAIEQALLQGKAEFNTIVDPNSTCLEKDASYPLVDGDRFQGRVHVTNISLHSSSELDEAKRLELGLVGSKRTNDEVAKTLKENQRIAVIALKSLGAFAGRRSALAPVCEVCKRVWVTEVASKLTDSEGMIIDLRHGNDFSAWHLPKAINLPLSDWLLLDGFSFEKLPNDKTMPLILYTYNPLDSKVFVLIQELEKRGYDNIQWIWEGADGLQGRKWTPAPDIKGVVTLDSVQVFRHLQKRTAAYYVGDSIDRTELIPTTNVIHFAAAFDETTLRPDFSKAFRDGVRITDVPMNKSAPIIVYGRGPDDWAPYVAAKWLRDSGWSRVYWYQGGLSEWLAARSHFDEIDAWSDRIADQ